ncbi:MAG: hypothetical protein AAGK66_02610 [Pseudomonadota bacterium]
MSKKTLWIIAATIWVPLIGIIGALSINSETEASEPSAPATPETMIFLSTNSGMKHPNFEAAFSDIRVDLFGLRNQGTLEAPTYALHDSGTKVGTVTLETIPGEEAAYIGTTPSEFAHAHFELEWSGDPAAVQAWCVTFKPSDGESRICD